jgi:hypothetical protein
MTQNPTLKNEGLQMDIEEARTLELGTRLKISDEAIARNIYPNRKTDFAIFRGIASRSIRIQVEGNKYFASFHPSFWDVA